MDTLLLLATGYEAGTERKLLLLQSGGAWREVTAIEMDSVPRLGPPLREGVDFKLAATPVDLRRLADQLVLLERQAQGDPVQDPKA